MRKSWGAIKILVNFVRKTIFLQIASGDQERLKFTEIMKYIPLDIDSVYKAVYANWSF